MGGALLKNGRHQTTKPNLSFCFFVRFSFENAQGWFRSSGRIWCCLPSCGGAVCLRLPVCQTPASCVISSADNYVWTCYLGEEKRDPDRKLDFYKLSRRARIWELHVCSQHEALRAAEMSVILTRRCGSLQSFLMGHSGTSKRFHVKVGVWQPRSTPL